MNKHTSIAYANDMAAPSLSKLEAKPIPHHIYLVETGDLVSAHYCSGGATYCTWNVWILADL